MPPRVSVVIATYNTGDELDPTIESIRGQLPPGQLELVLVDDGSTDGTGERVDALAAQEDWITGRRIPNSGWPSRPRNVGIDAAAGDYVLVMDHDDRLYAGGLAAMLAAADAHDADVVLGKEVRTGGRTQGLDTFRHNAGRADLVADDVLLLHTPHRLWRRAFLDAHAIRFDESIRRLEDHKIIAEGFEHEPVVSVVADRPCYRWIIHGDNNSLRPPDPTDYYGALRRVLDSVDRWPHDEATKDYARTMWLRTTVLDRFGRGGALSWPADYREELFRHARAITAERLPERLDPGLPALHRVRAALLRADDLPALLDYVRVDGTVTTRPELVAARSAGNTLTLTVRTQLVSEAGPVLFVREGSRVRQRPTGPLDPAVADRVLDVTDDLAAGRIDVMLTERSTNAEWFLPTTATSDLVTEGDSLGLTITASADLEASTALLGHPLTPGVWDVKLRTAVLGYDSRVAVRVGDGDVPAAWTCDGVRVTPYRTQGGRLALRVTAVKAQPASTTTATTTTTAGAVRRVACGVRRRLQRLRSSG